MSNEREAFEAWWVTQAKGLDYEEAFAGWQARAEWQRSQSAPDAEALKAEILSLTVRLGNSDAVIALIQKIITRLNKGEPDEQ